MATKKTPSKKKLIKEASAPNPPIDETANDQDILDTMSDTEKALVKGPAYHARTLPPRRRHGVRTAPPKPEPTPRDREYPMMLYDKKNRTKIVKNDKDYDDAKKGKKWFDTPQQPFQTHRHVEGAVNPDLEADDEA